MNFLKFLSTNTLFVLSLFGIYGFLGAIILLSMFSIPIYDMLDMLTLIIFSVIVGGAFSFLTMVAIVIKRNYKHFSF